MTDAATEHAESLVAKAETHLGDGELQKSYQLAKEALSLAPGNSNVQSLISRLQQSDSNTQILPLCLNYARGENKEDGEKALQFLKQKSPIPFQDIEELAALFLDQTGNSRYLFHFRPHPLLDSLTATLLSTSHPFRVEFAFRFSQRYSIGDTTRLFSLLYNRGEASFKALIQTVLDDSIWASSVQHRAAKRDAFQLALAKLLEPAVDTPEWLMMLLSRLLASHAEVLHEQPQLKLESLLTPANFGIVLSWLDIRGTQAVRSQTILVTARFLDEMKEGGKGEEAVSQYVTKKVAKTYNDDLIIAFSVATTCFPLCPKTVAKLFLTPGFLEGLVPILEENTLGNLKSHTLERASLELMSAACIDKACRGAIGKVCSTWLDDVANTSDVEEHSSLAALILSKIGQETTDGKPTVEVDLEGLPTILMNMTLNSTNPTARQSTIEGLAYTSLKPKVKEEIVSSTALLKVLIDTLKAGTPTDNVVFGILTIFSNVTSYRPTLTQEQKKMSQLSSYANSSAPPPEDPLDDDAAVTKRCKKVLDAGFVPALASHPVRSVSAIGLNQMAMILNSLAREQKHRGLLAQQGAVKLLLSISERLQGTGSTLEGPSKVAAHALARILISVNPTHVFSSSLPASSAIRPLLTLLHQDPEAETRNLLPTFEALLALTNLASTEDDSIRDILIRLAWPQFEELLLSSNTLVQRATVELVCNLQASPQGVMKFADGSKEAKQRLHVLLALADADDLATRRAAGGAIAMLTEWDKAAEAVLDMPRGVGILLGMCDDEEDMRHRGVVSLLNLVSMPDSKVATRAIEAIKKDDGVEVLKDMLRQSRDQTVLGIGVEVLKKLL